MAASLKSTPLKNKVNSYMQKVNLLYVITKLELGGAQKQLLSLIGNLDRNRFNIFLFTCREGLLMQEAVSINGISIRKSSFLGRPINPLKDFFALLEIYSFIRKHRIDVVHTHSSKAGILGRLAARMCRVRLILHTVHGWSFNDYQARLKRAIFVHLERFCANFTDKLIVVSDCDKQKGLENKIGSEDKYQIIRYGINYFDFLTKDANIKKELGIDNGELLVGTISCFKPQKAVQDFIKTAALVVKSFPGAKFIVIGDGVLRRTIEDLIDELRLKEKVILVGWRKDTYRILPSLDVFALTSLWEGLPIAALEALACGCPVVVTNTGGISEVVIEGKNGFLAPVHNIEKLSEKITSLLKDAKLRKEISDNSRNSLDETFTVEHMVGATQNLYEKLLKEKSVIHAN